MKEFLNFIVHYRSYEITRKDRMVKNVQRMQQTKGFKSFNFIPKTYVIPEEYHQYIGQYDVPTLVSYKVHS